MVYSNQKIALFCALDLITFRYFNSLFLYLCHFFFVRQIWRISFSPFHPLTMESLCVVCFSLASEFFWNCTWNAVWAVFVCVKNYKLCGRSRLITFQNSELVVFSLLFFFGFLLNVFIMLRLKLRRDDQVGAPFHYLLRSFCTLAVQRSCGGGPTSI